MLRTIICALLVGLIVMISSASADQYHITGKGGGAACFTKSAYQELQDAAAHARKTKDYSWMRALLSSDRCFRMKNGLAVTIKDLSIWGVSQIYLHPPGGGAPVAVWTANENFRR